MNYVLLLVAGFYFAHLTRKAGVEPFSSLYWQFMAAQVLLIIGASL